ncbi:hypothetical protein SAMN02745127_02990 [Oceanospirillum multiglobuliferum]|uniref:Uncharacterized protein n=1 Tax=Oceanospirillum multiglobuliferum TaxID=64969 RepID=A0A1T4SFE4_9GAMM|nr:hypothetical protein [Oceanospirillum multiglobuliferum]OPX54278.1 hypothetical protein BTE48_14890 [Oceanospirillum multiglobuliferum]SKA26648.1 hypothetical protein SAMN02745127_02990 [Oceanospirillum multiglobuliferum]
MRITNQLEHSQSVAKSLNTALTQSQGAQFSMLLSMITTPLYSTDLPGMDLNSEIDLKAMNLEADQQARKTAMKVNAAFAHALTEGNGGYYSYMRALTDAYPNLQQVTAVRPMQAPKHLYQVVSAPELGEKLVSQIRAAA